MIIFDAPSNQTIGSFFVVTKRTGIFDINVVLDLNNNFNSPKRNVNHNSIMVKRAWDIDYQ